MLAKKRRQLVYRGIYTGTSTSHPTQAVDITQVAVRYGTQQRMLVTLAGQPIYEFRPALLAQPVQAGNL